MFTITIYLRHSCCLDDGHFEDIVWFRSFKSNAFFEDPNMSATTFLEVPSNIAGEACKNIQQGYISYTDGEIFHKEMISPKSCSISTMELPFLSSLLWILDMNYNYTN